MQTKASSVVPSTRRRLTVSQRLLVATEILVTYGLARLWLARLSFPAAVAAARRVGKVPPPVLPAAELTQTALRIGSVVERMLRPLPVDSRCLVKALVLTRLLARRGIASTLVLGVRAKPEFAAHAWVEREGVALLPTSPEFVPLSRG